MIVSEHKSVVNKEALLDDLTTQFMWYQHNIENPMPTKLVTERELFHKYHSDTMFRRRVQNLACGVMCVIDKHIIG